MPYLSDNAYFAFKPEATAGTPVIPTIFCPLVSDDVKTDQGLSVDERMKGIDWESSGLLKGNRMHEGDIVILGDPDMLAHAMNMVMLKGTTTGDANGYIHPFTVGAPKSYTFEIKKGLYAQRYFGVYVDELKLDMDDGKLQVGMKIKAMGQFSVASVGIALSGSVTSLTLDDEYDIAPNRGLLVGDVLSVVKDDGSTVDLTLTSVSAGGVAVGFTSTSITAAIGNKVYLKPLTVTQPTIQPPFHFGNMLVGFGADSSAADTASASRSTSTPCYEISIVFNNKLFAKNGSSRIDPSQIIPGTRSCRIKLKQIFTDVAQRQKFLAMTKQAITVNALGKFIKSDFTTQESAVFKFFNVKMLDHDNKLEVGEQIFDEAEFAVLYDNSDAKAVTVDITNRTATGSY